MLNSKIRLSIGANVSLADVHMIGCTVPNWLRIFDHFLDEICLMIDPQTPTGRLGKQYSYYSDLDALMTAVKQLEGIDKRIKGVMLAVGEKKKLIQSKWFKVGYPDRCQSGTPIFAFINAVEALNSNNLILRCDSDMLFYEDGFIGVAHEKLISGSYDIIEPPLLGYPERKDGPISLGAFLMMPKLFSSRCIPITPHKIDVLRQIHRKFRGMSPYVNLEEMIAIEKKYGRVRHCNLDQSLGWSLHIAKRTDVLAPNFQDIVSRVENGSAPDLQRADGRNFKSYFWV